MSERRCQGCEDDRDERRTERATPAFRESARHARARSVHHPKHRAILSRRGELTLSGLGARVLSLRLG